MRRTIIKSIPGYRGPPTLERAFWRLSYPSKIALVVNEITKQLSKNPLGEPHGVQFG